MPLLLSVNIFFYANKLQNEADKGYRQSILHLLLSVNKVVLFF